MPDEQNRETLAVTIGRQLAESLPKDTDPNEVATVMATLRDQIQDEQDGQRLFQFLDTVIDNGAAVVRSKRTLDYYRNIRDVCRKHLTPYRDDPDIMLKSLGWVVRLMRFYRMEGRLEQPPSRVATESASQRRETGHVKWFDATKGFGFIVREHGGKDAFVHISDVEGRHLSQGQKVTFTVEQQPKGPAAKDVRPA